MSGCEAMPALFLCLSEMLQKSIDIENYSYLCILKGLEDEIVYR